jgi:hypothetical protein
MEVPLVKNSDAVLAVLWAGFSCGVLDITAALVVCSFHFVIAFGAAAVYFAASQGIRFLIENAGVSGVLYGVYFFMNRIVVPLSAAAKRPFSLKLMIVGVIIHILCVGLPISLGIRRFSK